MQNERPCGTVVFQFENSAVINYQIALASYKLNIKHGGFNASLEDKSIPSR